MEPDPEELERLARDIRAKRRQAQLDADRRMAEEIQRITPRQSIARTPPPTPPMDRSALDSLIDWGLETSMESQDAIASAGSAKRALPSPEGAPMQPDRSRRAGVAPPIAGLTGGGPPSVAQQPQDVPAANSNQTQVIEDTLLRLTKEQIVDASHAAGRGIMEAVMHASSRINKNDIADIGRHVEKMGAIVAALTVRLAEAELRACKAELAAASHKLAAATAAATVAVSNPTTTTQPCESYSSVLRFSGQVSRPKPTQNQGRVFAIYPAEKEADKIKTAEQTKVLLKTSVNPQALGVQVSGIRKVGNAGIVLHTTTVEAADKLKKAIPATLRIQEPKERAPLVAVLNVSGDVENSSFVKQIVEQNFADDPAWSGGKAEKDLQVAFKKWRRGGSATTVVLRCSPAMRDALVNRERVYLGWERYPVKDFVDVTCCNKCQMYGHVAKYCKAEKETCGKCGVIGHSRHACNSATTVCATCKAFKKNGAEGHKTGSLDCPARKYAVERALAKVNYG